MHATATMNELPRTPSRRADLLAVTFAVVLPSLVTLIYFVLLADAAPVIQHAAWIVTKTVQFGFPLFWVLAMQRQRIRLHWPSKKGLLEGLAFGLVVLVSMMALYHGWLRPEGYLDAPGEAIRQKVGSMGMGSLWSYVFLASLYSLVHSFAEEYYFRWFVFGQLKRLAPVGVAIAVSGLAFMAHHVIVLATYFGWLSPATWLFSAAVAIGGAYWAWLYHRSGSLYGPWLSHLVVDVAIFTLGYDMITAGGWPGN